MSKTAHSNENSHLIIEFKYTKSSYYCMWNCEADFKESAFALGQDGELLFAESIDSLCGLIDLGPNFKKRVHESYEIGNIRKWIDSNSNTVDCNWLLDIWNTLSDFHQSLGIYFYGDSNEVSGVHEKLFYGCNLPAITPEGETYKPVWTDWGVSTIKHVLNDGIDILSDTFLRK